MNQKAPFWAAAFLGGVAFLGGALSGCQQPQARELPAWPERPPPPVPGTTQEPAASGPIEGPEPASRAVPPREASTTLAEKYSGHRPLDRQTGEASYYADSLAGNSTASGEPYRPELYTAAHRTLPFGTIARVVRSDTGQVTYVKINDRGPFGKSKRIIDLSRAAAQELGMMRAGVVSVRVEILEKPAASASR